MNVDTREAILAIATKFDEAMALATELIKDPDDLALVKTGIAKAEGRFARILFAQLGR